MEIFNKEYFDEKEFNRPDPWSFWTSEYEQTKYKRQINVAKDLLKKQVEKIFEIGCAEGAHTKMIAEAFPQAEILAIDISENAINRARENLKEYIEEGRIKFVNKDILDYIDEIPENNFDLGFWSESIYYIGARLPCVDMYEFLGKVINKLNQGGVLIMANIIDQPNAPETPLTRRALMEAYHLWLSDFAKPVLKATYHEFKKEENQTFEYQIWAFRR